MLITRDKSLKVGLEFTFEVVLVCKFKYEPMLRAMCNQLICCYGNSHTLYEDVLSLASDRSFAFLILGRAWFKH